MVDKDQAEVNAIRKVFNESDILLCWYHVTQAVTRWLSISESGVNGPEKTDSRAHIIQFMSEMKCCSKVCCYLF
nr:novel protein [Danio rerio]